MLPAGHGVEGMECSAPGAREEAAVAGAVGGRSLESSSPQAGSPHGRQTRGIPGSLISYPQSSLWSVQGARAIGSAFGSCCWGAAGSGMHLRSSERTVGPGSLFGLP